MNPSRTLANRFRTQRTDKIRVGSEEVLSAVELSVEPGAVIEVVVERCRDDVVQGLRIAAHEACLIVEEPATLEHAGPSHQIALAARPGMQLDARVDEDTDEHHVVVWNNWIIDDVEQAWTGNSGIIVEELDGPIDEVDRRRLWCSDGLGNASFDDLVVVVTIGQPDSNDE